MTVAYILRPRASVVFDGLIHRGLFSEDAAINELQVQSSLKPRGVSLVEKMWDECVFV